jgi:hypothetical protein
MPVEVQSTPIRGYYLGLETHGVVILRLPSNPRNNRFLCFKQMLALLLSKIVGRFGHASHIISLREAMGYLPIPAY